MSNRAVAISITLAAAACGGGDPAGDDGGDDGPPGVDLAACVQWAATAPAALTALDGEQSQFPSLAALDDGWAVAWYDGRNGNQNDIYYAHLDPAGGRLTDDVLLTTETAIAGVPEIATNGVDVAVAYESFLDGNQEIALVRIDADGAPRGAPANVSRTPTFSSMPDVAATPDGWAVAWTEGSMGIPLIERVLLAAVGSDGASGGDAIAVTDGPQAFAPSIAADGADVRLAWSDRRDEQADIYTAPLDLSTTAAIAVTADAEELVPELARGNGGWGVAYHDSRVGWWQSYFARVDADGVRLGETRVSDTPYYATFPHAVWVGGVWVVTWQEQVGPDDDRIMAVRVAADGVLIGAPIEVVHDAGVGYGSIAAAPGGEVAMVWQDTTHAVELGFGRIVCGD